MRKVLTITVAVLLASATGALADDVTNTKHNLSTSGPGNYKASSETEICKFCHTPHNASPAVPLWNHDATSASFTMYTSGTINGTMDASPSGSSLMCLSCHDGTVSLGGIVNGSDIAMAAGYTNLASGSAAYLGTDLSNDHPISITINTVGDPDLQNPASLVLESSKVQCGTCHNPHDNTNSPLLEMSNSGSALCKQCHLK